MPRAANLFSNIIVEEENTTRNQDRVSDQSTYVYVWNMTKDNPGHVSMKAGDEYLSLWPKNFPSVGPTTILPLKPSFAKNLSEDEQAEAISRKTKFDGFNNDPTSIIPDDGNPISPLPPDHTFKIDGLDTHKIKEEIIKQKEDQNIRYQLLPGVNLLGFFNRIFSFDNFKPVDVPRLELDPPAEQIKLQPHNCSTIVGAMLKLGGQPIQTTRSPWVLTPNDIAKQLSILRK
jgi:hypothetical protein